MDTKKYEEWVQTKLSPKFHPNPEDSSENELRTIIEDFIEIGNRLDIMKKRKFYGRLKGHENFTETGVNVRQYNEPFVQESEQEQILHAVMGMATETVEMLEAIHASKWGGKEFDTVNFLEEMGDLEFYRSIPYHQLNWTEKQVRDTNYFKLEKRYPEGYTDNSANNRDLESERKILEKGLANDGYFYMSLIEVGAKIPLKFKPLIEEIKANFNESIDYIFDNHEDYQKQVEIFKSNNDIDFYETVEYEDDWNAILSDFWKFSEDQLLKFKSYKQLKEKDVIEKLNSANESNELVSNNDFSLQEKTFFSETKFISKSEFQKGLISKSFKLNRWDENYIDWKKIWMNMSVELFSTSPIYYGDILIVEAFHPIISFPKIFTWTADLVINEKFELFIDLRIKNISDDEYDYNLLNFDFIDITAVFKVPQANFNPYPSIK